MKIALIAPEVVIRSTSGSELRLYQFQTLLERIAPGQVVIWDLGVWGDSDNSSATPAKHQRSIPPEVSAIRKMIIALRNLVALGCYLWPSFTVRSLGWQHERILAWIDQERPTSVVMVHPFATELVPALKERGIKIFIDCHSVHSDLERQLVELTPIGVERLAALVEWRAVLRREKHYFPMADEIWIPSELDAERQRRVCLGQAQVRCVPNVLDVAQYEPRSDSGTHDIVLPASFDFSPNVVGAKLLRDQVLPIVRQTVSDARLVLLGKDVHGYARALQREPDVIVTGEVPDTQPYLRRAGVVAVPLLQGGGTRYKILEAFALGIPVVSTPLGCEGLEAHDGVHLLIRDIDQFATAIVSILRDPARGRELGLRGRQLVEAKYSWAAAEDIVRLALSQGENLPLQHTAGQLTQTKS